MSIIEINTTLSSDQVRQISSVIFGSEVKRSETKLKQIEKLIRIFSDRKISDPVVVVSGLLNNSFSGALEMAKSLASAPQPNTVAEKAKENAIVIYEQEQPIQVEAEVPEKKTRQPKAPKEPKQLKAPKQPKEPKQDSEAKAGSRFSKNSVANIYPQVDVNPRREGSHGHRSMEIVINNHGINVSEFIQAGGRVVDLRWDLDHGNVRIEG